MIARAEQTAKALTKVNHLSSSNSLYLLDLCVGLKIAFNAQRAKIAKSLEEA